MARQFGIFSILFFVGFVGSSAASASPSTPNCYTLNKLASQYQADFNIQMNRWWSSPFKCQSIPSKIYTTFYYLDTIKFRVKEPNFYKMVKKNVLGVYYYPQLPLMPDAKMSEASGHIFFFDKFISDVHDPADMVQRLIHQTRHTMEGDPGHEKCIRGNYINSHEKLCDKKFMEDDWWNGGGYNYGFAYSLWFLEYSYGHDLSRGVAERNLKYMVSNRFNDIAPEQIIGIYGKYR